LLSLLCAATALADDQTLKPYEAIYKTSVGGLSVTLERRLSVDDNGVCKLTSEGQLLVASISEVSTFTVSGDQVEPRSYVYRLSYGPVNRRREVHFDPGSEVIRSLYKKRWYELPREPGTLDRMSQQEQLRLFLLNDPTPREDIVLHVADGRKVKDYRFRYLGDETLHTPMGAVDTMHFARVHKRPEERESSIWIAPEWDYLMVRTVHVEEGNTTEANLVSARMNGKPLRAVAG